MKQSWWKASCITLTLSSLGGCVHSSPPASSPLTAQESEANKAFTQFTENFLTELWKLEPDWAISVGYYQTKDLVNIPDAAQRERFRQFCLAQQVALQSFDQKALNATQQVDLQLIQNFLAGSLWSLEKERSFAWNPAAFNISPGIAQLFEASRLSREEKLRAALVRFQKAKTYYAAAMASLEDPTLEHTRLALTQHEGLAAYWRTSYLPELDKSQLSAAEQQDFKTQLESAAAATREYQGYLKKLEARLQKQGARSFRMPAELYRQKFVYDLGASLSADEIYAKALTARDTTLTRMDKLASELFPKYYPGEKLPKDRMERIRRMIQKLSEQHTEPAKFRETIAEQIPELERFVRSKDLIYLDPSKPLKVRDTPIYARGVAGASVDAPGPYDKGGETYYNVSPIDDGSKEKALSYLREYNNYTLQILNIHEAIPGHYTQLVHSNESPSPIKSILGNSTMIEGWAVYAERMMLEEGYGNSPELWLMYYKWHLRVILNTILDYEVHLKQLSREKGLAMLREVGFQEQAEAEEKWKRATLTQVQLASYFTGFTEIYDFRESLKAKQGSQFQLRAFHDRFLSFGSAPVKSIRALMENEVGTDNRLGQK